MNHSRAVTILGLLACAFPLGCSVATPDTSSNTDPTSSAVGPAGPDGAQGDTGAQGAAGADGLVGADGIAGIAGQVGPAGPKGDTGANAPPSLVKLTVLPKGDGSCPGGGLKVEIGPDTNGSTILDPSEVLQTSFACQPLPRMRVAFVTSQAFDGNLGGVAGGDAKCQASADAVPALAGKTFKAWLSDAITEPAATFTSDGAFVNTNGVLLAESYTDFRDTALLARLTTETGASLSTFVWTGTDENATRSTDRCAEWTSNSSSDSGIYGDSSLITWYWSISGVDTCDNLGSLYCVEQ